ncbi:hypothetical protein D9758_009000 [Tetrapyrgos nigripes]|uniref:DDE Tnp4 domain-containing protein n=1 Tax=Tetrapyrgos nigripes TaxID=182062 RepID=A0A8H5GKC8_9AGAR|nr:hypothetical protein D9758_009000 [Tetrapyrgos nigripes]
MHAEHGGMDGVLLAYRPYWYGKSYFDCKSRYSLNVQIVLLPNWHIIDFSYGHVGSTHDATAWEETRLFKEYESLLQDEWIWADSAYPIQIWVVTPYKKPDCYKPENEEFNEAVRIDNAQAHHISTFWIAACIGIHSHAMQSEAKEKDEEGGYDFFERDPFLAEGHSDGSDVEEVVTGTFTAPRPQANGRVNPHLAATQEFCEKLKADLFASRHCV